MTNLTFLTIYLAALLLCILLTVGIITLINPGLKTYFNSLIQDYEIAKFFVRLISLILFLAGFSAALENSYVIEKASWLTLSWDAIDQVQATLSNIFTTLIVFSVSFLILDLIHRRFTR